MRRLRPLLRDAALPGQRPAAGLTPTRKPLAPVLGGEGLSWTSVLELPAIPRLLELDSVGQSAQLTVRVKGWDVMSQETLWDFLDQGGDREAYLESCDRDEARRRTIKRLRASGHWLTLLRVARAIPQPFTLNDVSVAVWRACPEFFGMKGYPYPRQSQGPLHPLRQPRPHRPRHHPPRPRGALLASPRASTPRRSSPRRQEERRAPTHPDVLRGTKRSAAEFMQ